MLVPSHKHPLRTSIIYLQQHLTSFSFSGIWIHYHNEFYAHWLAANFPEAEFNIYWIFLHTLQVKYVLKCND